MYITCIQMNSLIRDDVNIQVAATATVCIRLKKLAILLFQFSHYEISNIGTYCRDTIIHVYLNE